MMRSLGGVVLGYLTMAAFVILSFPLALRIMGADLVFRPGVFDVSGLWIITSVVLGLIGAVLGGYVCATVARNVGAPKKLAVVVIVVGVALALPSMTGDAPTLPREATVASSEAMQSGRQPGWLALLNPLIGAVGVLWGARLKRAREPSAAA
ncbi:MAG: hypothetical protein O7E50_00770 [Gemmatimonadetes bacterium]|nr:hypothetical protein [Gemmatimonadota bacterium]